MTLIDRIVQKVESLREAMFGNYEYQVPKDPEQELYDFYAITNLGSRYPDLPPPKPDVMQRDDLTWVYDDVREKCTRELRDHLLRAVLLAICAEFRHIFTQNKTKVIYDFFVERGLKDFIRQYTVAYDLFKKDAPYMQTGLRKVTAPFGQEEEKGYINSYKAVASTKIGQVSFVKAAGDAFSKLSWASSYGGDAWASICKAWLFLREAKDLKTLAIAVDHIYDIHHNTGTVLNKCKEYYKHGGYSWLKSALDFKAHIQNPYEFVDKISSGLRPFYLAQLHNVYGTSLEAYERKKHPERWEKKVKAPAGKEGSDWMITVPDPFICTKNEIESAWMSLPSVMKIEVDTVAETLKKFTGVTVSVADIHANAELSFSEIKIAHVKAILLSFEKDGIISKIVPITPTTVPTIADAYVLLPSAVKDMADRSFAKKMQQHPLGKQIHPVVLKLALDYFDVELDAAPQHGGVEVSAEGLYAYWKKHGPVLTHRSWNTDYSENDLSEQIDMVFYVANLNGYMKLAQPAAPKTIAKTTGQQYTWYTIPDGFTKTSKMIAKVQGMAQQVSFIVIDYIVDVMAGHGPGEISDDLIYDFWMEDDMNPPKSDHILLDVQMVLGALDKLGYITKIGSQSKKASQPQATKGPQVSGGMYKTVNVGGSSKLKKNTAATLLPKILAAVPADTKKKTRFIKWMIDALIVDTSPDNVYSALDVVEQAYAEMIIDKNDDAQGALKLAQTVLQHLKQMGYVDTVQSSMGGEVQDDDEKDVKTDPESKPKTKAAGETYKPRKTSWNKDEILSLVNELMIADKGKASQAHPFVFEVLNYIVNQKDGFTAEEVVNYIIGYSPVGVHLRKETAKSMLNLLLHILKELGDIEISDVKI